MKAARLVCKGCSAVYPLEALFACDQCFGPLEVGYDDVEAPVSRAAIEAGPPTLWRYAGFLPVAPPGHGLPVGRSPLIRADRLAAELGLDCELYVKTETSNPTHSFKDRVVAVAAAKAVELGYEALACASTGNLAGATAAAAAALGLPAYIFVPADLEREKIVAAAAYGATVFAVDGSYDDVNRLCSELAETDAFEKTAFVNVNVRPYYAEGSKTLGYEVAEQLGWRLPRQVLIPMASGSMLTKIDKAFGELASLGLVEPAEWRVFGAQSTGCSPISTAFALGRDVVEPVRPTGIAKSLAIGNPADGPYALDAVRRTGGAIADVDDDEIRDGIELLARTTGIFAETAGGVVVATLRKLIAAGALDPAEQTVIYNTGDGLKTLDAVAGRQAPTVTVKPSLRAAREAGLLD